MSYEEQSIKKYNTFTGVDISLSYDNIKIGTISTINFELIERIGHFVLVHFDLDSVYDKNNLLFEISLTKINNNKDLVCYKLIGVKFIDIYNYLDLCSEIRYKFSFKQNIDWHNKEEDHTGQVWNEYNQCWSWL